MHEYSGVKIPSYGCVTVNLYIFKDYILINYIFTSIKICFICLGAPDVGCINVYKGYTILLARSLYHNPMAIFGSYYGLCFKVYFIR